MCQGCCPDANTQPEDCPRGGGVAGSGMAGTVQAFLEAPFLASALGSETVEVVFNLGGWVPILRHDPRVQVLARGEDGRPLMVLFEPSPGGGRVAYTSFHNHAQATEAMNRMLAALVLRL